MLYCDKKCIYFGNFKSTLILESILPLQFFTEHSLQWVMEEKWNKRILLIYVFPNNSEKGEIKNSWRCQKYQIYCTNVWVEIFSLSCYINMNSFFVVRILANFLQPTAVALLWCNSYGYKHMYILMSDHGEKNCVRTDGYVIQSDV